MRSFYLVYFAVLMIVGHIHAQDQIPVAKTAIVNENGRITVNKDLGLYLWLSVSPDENSKKVRLMSDSSRKHTNPMYFDTEGYNTFRSPSAVDTTTRRVVYPLQDIIFEVYSDSKPPVTKLIVSGENSKTKRNKNIYTNTAYIELKPYDGTSGVEKTYFSINNEPYKEYKDKFSITNTGENVLLFYSTDKVGNREEAQKQKIIIR